jgi:hypothetical protein
MSAHDHTTIVPGCYRCDLNKDELPTPLEAAAQVIADAPSAFPSDTSTAREAIEAALDAVDLERLLESEMRRYNDESLIEDDVDLFEYLEARVRAAILGGVR